jgi:hypothetical protein
MSIEAIWGVLEIHIQKKHFFVYFWTLNYGYFLDFARLWRYVVVLKYEFTALCSRTETNKTMGLGGGPKLLIFVHIDGYPLPQCRGVIVFAQHIL